MKIKYTGPRPHITHHGITFKDGKEDKYVYLSIALQILRAIDRDFSEAKTYSYDVNTKRLGDEEILGILLGYETTLEEDVAKEVETYTQKLDEEMHVVENRENLTEVEKETWIGNLEIMKEYRIQRAINKICYMHAVNEIAKVIRREKIKEIDTPFYEKFWHVLRTIEGELANSKNPTSSSLKIEKNARDEMVAKLNIAIY